MVPVESLQSTGVAWFVCALPHGVETENPEGDKRVGLAIRLNTVAAVLLGC